MMKPGLRQWLVFLACAGVLLAVLSLYLQPSFMVHLANQVWACF